MRAPPVRWLSPTELARTGATVLQGTIFARYADKREAMGAVPGHAFDLTAIAGSDADLVIDYVADLGDGFEATYAVACSIGRVTDVVTPPTDMQALDDSVSSAHCGCDDESDPAGHLLVMGGDQVYPVADVATYRDRTLDVYRAASAFGAVPAGACAAALPGNHDWYDGLVAFRRVFCESWVNTDPRPLTAMDLPPQRMLDRFGGEWRVFQERSYFAVQLPHGWWLWGIDIQLNAPIDAEQLAYFRRARLRLGHDDRVVLCTGKPSWTDSPERDDERKYSERQTLAWFVDRMFSNDKAKGRVRLILSGDKHHYARYAPVGHQAGFSPTLVTCGGGGAYLSSTHHLEQWLTPFTFERQQNLCIPGLRDDKGEEVPPQHWSRQWRLQAAYPTADRSKELRRSFWKIPFCNDKLPILVIGIYALLTWCLSMAQARSARPSLGSLRAAPLSDASVGSSLPLVALVSLLVLLLSAYAKAGSKMSKKRALACGVGHAAGHLVAVDLLASLLGWATRQFWPDRSGPEETMIGALVVLAGAALAVLWGFLGAMVFALYLRICDGLDRPLHENEIFAGMRIEDYKSHLRIHVTPDELHVRVIGLDEIPRHDEWCQAGYEVELDDKVHTGTRWLPAAGPISSREIDRFVVTRDPA